MSHIVVDAREYTSSTGRYMFNLLKYLEKVDTVNDYTILLKPKDMEVYAFSNPKFTKVVCPHKEFTFDEQIGLKKQLDRLQPDLVHFGMVQQPVLYTGKVVTTMQDLTGIRFKNPAKNVVTFTLKQQIYKWVNKRVAKKSDAIITPTEFVKQDVVQFTGISPDKITVTLESADPITDPPALLDYLQNTDFIMYVGRPTPHKNLERLVDAFAILQTTHPALKLVFAGKKDANYQRIEANVQKRGMSNVVFTDFIPDSQLRWLYEHCQAYVFPSLSEGFGLPGLEAMSHGAPVVSSNATCLPEVHGAAAHYFDPLDVHDMATKIAEVLDDSKLRSELITKSKEQVKKFSWQRMAEQTLAVYTKVLAEK